MSRLVGLIAWKKDFAALVGRTNHYDKVYLSYAREKFIEVSIELIGDVRGTLNGEASRMPELWAREEEQARKATVFRYNGGPATDPDSDTYWESEVSHRFRDRLGC